MKDLISPERYRYCWQGLCKTFLPRLSREVRKSRIYPDFLSFGTFQEGRTQR